MLKRISSSFLNWVESAPQNSNSIRKGLKDLIELKNSHKREVDGIYELLDNEFESQLSLTKQSAMEKYKTFDRDIKKINEDTKKGIKEKFRQNLPNLDDLMKEDKEMQNDQQISQFADLNELIESANRIKDQEKRAKVKQQVDQLNVGKSVRHIKTVFTKTIIFSKREKILMKIGKNSLKKQNRK